MCVVPISFRLFANATNIRVKSTKTDDASVDSGRYTMSTTPKNRSGARPARLVGNLTIGFVVASLLLASVGCQTVVHRPGVAATEEGMFQRYVAASPAAVIDVALPVYREWGLLVQSQNAAGITGRTQTGSIVTLTVRRRGSLTRVWVQVTPDNDETLSTALLDEVANRLER